MSDFEIKNFNKVSNTPNLTNRKELLALKAEDENKVKINDISSSEMHGFKVVFETKDKELVSLKLSKENYENLQNHFSSYTNYVAKEDGSIRLNGEANEFISEWFEKLSNEFFNLNSHNEKSNPTSIKFHKNTLNESLQNLKVKSDEISNDENMEKKLNFIIGKDINKDVNVDEFDIKEPSISEILSELKKVSGGESNAMHAIDPQKKAKKDENEVKIKEKDDEDLLEKAKEKGFNSLSADEQAKLRSSNPRAFEELFNDSLQELSQNLSKELKTRMQNKEALFLDKLV